MTLGFQPTEDNVLVRLVATKNAGAERSVAWADVLAVGPGRRTADGTLVVPDLAPGDRVAVRPHSPTHLCVHGQKLAVIGGSDVLGVLLRSTDAAHAQRDAAGGAPVVAEPPAMITPTARAEESLETDVAPDLLDRQPPTAEDLH